MKELAVLNKAQKIINSQFDKILNISIDENTYRIAIRRDEIPKIRNLSTHDNALIISFMDLPPKVEFNEDFYLKENNEGKIEAVYIRNADKLENESYRNKLNKKLLKSVKDTPETNKHKILQKHFNKRIVHSISEIIKTVPASDED